MYGGQSPPYISAPALRFREKLKACGYQLENWLKIEPLAKVQLVILRERSDRGISVKRQKYEILRCAQDDKNGL
jgi:hypothetical protein